jgi:hypothetical protein
MAFWRGVLVAFSSMSLFSDLIGEEAWRSQPWVDSRISVPLAILWLAVAFISLFFEAWLRGRKP